MKERRGEEREGGCGPSHPSETPEGTMSVAVRCTKSPRTHALKVTCFSHPCTRQCQAVMGSITTGEVMVRSCRYFVARASEVDS